MTIEAAYQAVLKAEHHDRCVWDRAEALWHPGAAIVALARMRWIVRGTR